MENHHVADTAVGNLSVLLGPHDLPGLRREAPRTEQMYDFHCDIRNLMIILETGALEDGSLVDGALEVVKMVVNLAVEWPNWKSTSLDTRALRLCLVQALCPSQRNSFRMKAMAL